MKIPNFSSSCSRGEKYKQSARTSGGAEKWLDVRLWRTSTDAILAAKAAGYRVVATHLREDAVDVRDVDWSVPTAVVLGNERAGNFILSAYNISCMKSFGQGVKNFKSNTLHSSGFVLYRSV